MRNFLKTTAVLSVLLIGAASSRAGELQQDFNSPPDSSKPLTWWHWIDGNVTKPGITRDLEAMKSAGLGGCYLFSIGGFFPKGPATFGTPGWYDLLTHSVNEAERLGLVFGVHNCDGWSESGGPWIAPETSMKELTHTNIDVAGGQVLDITLPIPPNRTNFYRDIAVVAFPLPDGGRLNDSDTDVKGTAAENSTRAVSDGDIGTRASFPASALGHNIEFAMPAARTIRSMTIRNANGYGGDDDLPVVIEASIDGKSWGLAGKCSLAWDTANGAKPITVAFDELKARLLRISFTNEWNVEIGEIELSDAAKVHFGEAKAAWLRTRGHGGESRNLSLYPGPDRQRTLAPERVIAKGNVQNLRSKMDQSGHLKWNVPAGKWRILRVGYTTNGRSNKPATDAGRGLECDKLDPQVVRNHLDQYVGKLTELFGEKTGKVFKVVETDSWECDVQNWTADFEKRFESRVGFDLVPWMPVLLEGWIMDNADVSDRVLWEWRRFLADQFAENYFAQVKSYLKQRGLTYVCEGSGRQMYLYDAVGYQRDGDVPMGEFWLNTGSGQGVRVDNKVASSVAHIMGKRVVASESYTASARFARWQNHPYTLKPLGDRAFCAGVNQFVFHTFAHQPYEVAGPGFTMAVWGLNCNRANTWWEPGKAWMQYLARCNHLLQEGVFSADVLAFIGEDVPNRIGWRNELNPELPPGYDFDGCDATTLLLAQVRDKKIVVPGGTEYRVLVLPDKRTMSPAILEKIAALAKEGAVVVGPPPQQSPRLRDIGVGDEKVRKLAKEIWGACDGNHIKEQAYGRGRVFWGTSFPEVFRRIDLPADFAYKGGPDSEVIYIHRRIEDSEVFFIANQKPQVERVTAQFRVKGKQPELWDPISGQSSLPGLYRPTPYGVELPLELDPAGSIFVVFRSDMPKKFAKMASKQDVKFELVKGGGVSATLFSPDPAKVVFSDGSEKIAQASNLPEPLTIKGSWDLAFPAGLGAPSTAVFEELVSWTDRPEAGIRYFSGTATYTKNFDFAADNLGNGRQAWLDLGEVRELAQVRLNGVDLGILWKPPFRLDVTRALKAGKNRLEVRVTNLWPNRMIGDEQLPDTVAWQKKKADPLPARWPDWVTQEKPRPDGRVTFCTRKPYKKDDPLLPSGLLGPVRIVTSQSLDL